MRYIKVKTNRESRKIISEIFKTKKNTLPLSVSKKTKNINIYVPFVNWNALTMATKIFGKRNWIIIVNTASVAKEASPEKRRFVANSIVSHELEHVNIMSENYNPEDMDYCTFMALAENTDSETKSFLRRFADTYISKNTMQENNVIYYSSSIELKCLHEGVESSIYKYGNLLSSDDYLKMNDLNNVIEQLKNNIELRCHSKFHTTNRFVENIISINHLYAKKPKKVENKSYLKEILPYDENFLNVKYLYENRLRFNKNLVDSFLVQILLTTQNDFGPLFAEHPESKEYISECIDDYIAEKNRFICNAHMTKFLIGEEFLYENLSHIKRNFKLLQAKATEYGLALTKKPAIWVA